MSQDTTTSSAHTPAPWYAVRNGDQIDIHWKDTKKDMERTVITDARECDAHLIAAAPELLEALQAVESAFQWADNEESEDPIKRIVLDAIAKATQA